MNRRILIKYFSVLPFLGTIELPIKEDLTKSPELKKWLVREMNQNGDVYEHRLYKVSKRFSDKMISMERPLGKYTFKEGTIELDENENRYIFKVSLNGLDKFVRVGSLPKNI